MSSILISKPRLCLNYTKLLFDPRIGSLTPPTSKNLPFLFKARELPRACLFCTNGGNRPFGHSRRDVRPRDGNIRERPAFPKFAAGTAKRTADLQRRKASPQEEEEPDRDVHTKALVRPEPPNRPLSASGWRKLQESATRPETFAVYMMQSLLRQRGDLEVAKSLLAFVATETGTLPYKLLLYYLALCVEAGHHGEVFDLYDIMRARFRLFDTGGYTLFIKGFSRTECWRQALDMLQDIKRLVIPSPRNYGNVIDAAVRHGDMGVAWALYDEVIEQGLVPDQETWRSLFQGRGSSPEQQERLQGVLMYMRDNQLYPQEDLAQTINSWFQNLPDQTWKGSWTTVDPSGVCLSCKEQLESIQLTEDEYSHLQESVIRHIIQGGDIFNKTTPEELESFMAFVEKKPAFDIVIDGLNVAHSRLKRGQNRQSEILLAVVSELARQGQTMLVLGRRHMLTPSRCWDRHQMAQIQQMAHCFFTDNISEDDPFLLYATLHSGNHCNFLSDDMMRDHKACLPDGVTSQLFFKWQRGHQLVLNGLSQKKRVFFQRIPTYDTIVQTTGRSWHIPYDEDGTERTTFEVPQLWLCLSKTH